MSYSSWLANRLGSLWGVDEQLSISLISLFPPENIQSRHLSLEPTRGERWKENFYFSPSTIAAYNSQIYDEMQTSESISLYTAIKMGLLRQFDFPQPTCEFQVGFPLLWIKAYSCLS